jgi:hypothetical protein
MGAGPNYVLDKGFLAQGATAYAFGEGVVFGSVEQSVVRATTALTAPGFFGVVQEDLDATRLATGKAVVGVRILGITRAIAGAAVAKGALLVNDTSARLVTQGGAAGTPSVGIALTAATNAGDHIDVLLTPGSSK